MSRKRGDAPLLSLKDRRRAAMGRVSGQQRRREQTLLEEIGELSAEEIVEVLDETPAQQANTRRATPIPNSPGKAPQYPPLGRGTPQHIPAPSLDAEVRVLEQNTETAKKLLTYDTAIDANPLEAPATLECEADDTAVDVRMDAKLMATLKALQAKSTGDQEESIPGSIWTSDFGSSQDKPHRPDQPLTMDDLDQVEEVLPVRFTDDSNDELTARRHARPAQYDTSETKAAPPRPQPRERTPASPVAAIAQSNPGLRPLSLRDSHGGNEGVGSTMDIKAPRPSSPSSQGTSPQQNVETAIHNRQILQAFRQQDAFVYLHFSEQGQLSLATEETKNSAHQFAFPLFDNDAGLRESDKERLISMSIPIGFVKDDMGGLCESHLVLAKARRSAPIWSSAVAELQATSVKTLQFKKWLAASEEDLGQLTEIQKEQLLLLLDEQQFNELLHNEASTQNPAPKAGTSELPQLTDADIIDTNAKRKAPGLPPKPRKPAQPSRTSQPPKPRLRPKMGSVPSRIMHPSASDMHVDIHTEDGPGPTNPLAPAHPDRKSARTNQPNYFDDIPQESTTDGPRPHTLAHTNIPMVSSSNYVNRDDTAMRRIRVDTAPLDPQGLRLHVKIPRKFAGKWFKGAEETLSIYGSRREVKLPQLGLTLQFTFSQSAQGKVFPQVILTRSTNVKDIQYAGHHLEIYANRNPQSEDGWDHIQHLQRGHVAQIDLSPTDQLRGILEIYVQHPEHGLVTDPITAAWSVEE